MNLYQSYSLFFELEGQTTSQNEIAVKRCHYVLI